eukprot:m.164190 g.164190  ORF g.164190 m.164190 type:complete len:62 (-) comp14651_c0_seq1:4549-4734(-)
MQGTKNQTLLWGAKIWIVVGDFLSVDIVSDFSFFEYQQHNNFSGVTTVRKRCQRLSHDRLL